MRSKEEEFGQKEKFCSDLSGNLRQGSNVIQKQRKRLLLSVLFRKAQKQPSENTAIAYLIWFKNKISVLMAQKARKTMEAKGVCFGRLRVWSHSLKVLFECTPFFELMISTSDQGAEKSIQKQMCNTAKAMAVRYTAELENRTDNELLIIYANIELSGSWTDTLPQSQKKQADFVG